MGEDTGRNRGVSGISRGVTEGLSCIPNGAHSVMGPLELGGGVMGALYVWFGRIILGLKPPDWGPVSERLVRDPLGMPKSNSEIGLCSCKSKFCRRPATLVRGLPSLEHSCSSRGLVGRLVVLRREGDGASASSESSPPRFRFGERRYLVGEEWLCIFVSRIWDGLVSLDTCRVGLWFRNLGRWSSKGLAPNNQSHACSPSPD